jgi:WD40 repeat protein
VASSSQQRSAFVNYACTALPHHVAKSKALDADITSSLARFLRTNILSWIEHLANQGDLETVLQFAQVLKVFLRRKSRVELLLGDEVVVIDTWATDLVRLISKFGRQILMHPESILNIIPPFCPLESSPFTQFARSPGTAIAVHGLSSKDWDDCLCAAVLSDPKPTPQGTIPRERLHSLAASDDKFCIGTSTGRIVAFNEQTCLEETAVEHGQPVTLIQYATSKYLLASASRKMIRVWNSETWQQQWEYPVKYNCLAMAFVDDDRLLMVVLNNNTLLAMNLIDRVVTETCWTEMLEEPHRSFYHSSSPQFVSFNTDSGLLAIAYRSRRLFVYNYESDSYQIFDHKDGLSEGITQASAISIYSLAFSNVPDSSLIAVSYSSSDLVLFDTEAGTINVSVPKSHFSHLVSSPDGRTLAAATRDGTIELYDFETLHKLYRIRSDGGAVSVMKFTANSTRLLVIRAGGHDCRVWGPATLYRREVENTSVRSPSLGSGSQDGVYDQPDSTVNHITAIGCDPSGAFIFVGKDDHSVSVYDTKTGLPVTVLFSHHDTIKLLHLGVKGPLQILISVDTAGSLMAHKITRIRQDWSTELLYSYRGPVGGMHQLLCGQDLSNVLVVYSDQTTVLAATTGAEVASITTATMSPNPSEVSRWAQHPTDPNLLLHLTASAVSIHAWSTLEHATPAGREIALTGHPVSDLQIHTAMPLFTGANAMLLTTLIHPPYGPRGHLTTMCYSATALKAPPPGGGAATPLPGSQPTCDAIDAVLGTYRERLVFLHADGWVCSVKAAGFRDGGSDGPGAIMHHFAPPSDWLLASKMLIQVTRLGDVLFVVRGEVAVVKRGFERTADVGKGN